MQAETILSRNATAEERKAFIAEYEKLKREGHAVTIDDTREYGAQQGEMRIHHYKTCLRCVGAI